jgi:hypothetical protein
MTTPVEVSSPSHPRDRSLRLSTTRRFPTFPSTHDALPVEMKSTPAFVLRGGEGPNQVLLVQHVLEYLMLRQKLAHGRPPQINLLKGLELTGR